MMILRQLTVFFVGALCLLGFEAVLDYTELRFWSEEESREEVRKEVVITKEDVQQIRQELTEKIGSNPTPLQLESAISRKVENEVLVNEALLMGLHNIDSVVRQRVLLNMTFVGEDESDEVLLANAKSLGMFRHDIVVRRRLIERMKKIIVSQVTNAPTKDELLQYFQQSKDKQVSRYQRKKSVRLVHGYFLSSKYSIEKVAALHQQWIDGELSDNGMQSLADTVLVNSSAFITDSVVNKLFGEAILARIADVNLGQTNNGFLPIQEKSLGYHFIRAISFLPRQYRSYAAVEAQVRSDYIDEKRKQVLVSTLEELKAEYNVIQ